MFILILLYFELADCTMLCSCYWLKLNNSFCSRNILTLLQTCRNLSFTKDSYVPEKGHSTAQRALFGGASSSASHSSDVDLNSLNLSHWFSPNNSGLCSSENSERLSSFMNENDDMESMGRLNVDDTTGNFCGTWIYMLIRLCAFCRREFAMCCQWTHLANLKIVIVDIIICSFLLNDFFKCYNKKNFLSTYSFYFWI